MPASFKSRLRDRIPPALQVPVKYWLDQTRGFVEPEMRLFRHLISKGDRVLDVGGNRGVYAYHCWKLGGIVEVFEPNPVCVRVLEAWAEGRAGVRLHAVALSNMPGTAQLHIPVDAAGVEHDASASIEQHAFPNSRDEAIPLRTLDSYDFDDARLIKIDVEGHEANVISGAAATLARSQPGLLIEIEQRHIARPIGDVFRQVADHGYRGFFLGDGRLRPIDEFDLARDQSPARFTNLGGRYINNFLFLHEARLLAGDYRSLLETFGTR